MGSYIHIGIAVRIVVEKKQRGYSEKNFTANEILDRLDSIINLDYYNIVENKEAVGLSLKENIIEKYLLDFLIEQSYDLKCGQEIRKDLERIKNKTGYEILEMIQRYELGYVYYIADKESKKTYFDNELNLCIEGITYLSEGKVVIENVGELFHYIHQLIRRSSNNPIKDTTYLTIQ